jgi:hypothetical protein
MNGSLEIFSAGFDRDRRMWTRSSLSVATYDEYRGILLVLFENMHHDYPDMDKCVLIEDVIQLINNAQLTDDFNSNENNW